MSNHMLTRFAREKFPQGKVGDTAKVRVPDVDCGKCAIHRNGTRNTPFPINMCTAKEQGN